MNWKTRLKLFMDWKVFVVGVCVFNFVMIQWLPWLVPGTSTTSSAIFMGAYYKAFISGGFEVFRFFTMGFVHISLWHLLINLMAFRNLVSICEALYSKKQTMIILISGIIFGGIFTYCLDGNTVAVGLSAGLYAFLGAYVIFVIENRLYRNPQIRSSLLLTLLLNLMISFLPNISLTGHFGGFVAGLGFGVIYSRSLLWDELRRNTKIAAGVLGVALAFMIVRSYEIDRIYMGTDSQVYQIERKIGLGFYADFLENRMETYYANLGGRK